MNLKKYLELFKSLGDRKKSIIIVRREKHKFKGIWNSYLYTKKEQIKLNDVLYILSLMCSLILVGTLIDKNNIVVFMKDNFFVFKNLWNRLIIRFGSKDSSNGFYKIGDNIAYSVNAITNDDKKYNRWLTSNWSK